MLVKRVPQRSLILAYSVRTSQVERTWPSFRSAIIYRPSVQPNSSFPPHRTNRPRPYRPRSHSTGVRSSPGTFCRRTFRSETDPTSTHRVPFNCRGLLSVRLAFVRSGCTTGSTLKLTWWFKGQLLKFPRLQVKEDDWLSCLHATNQFQSRADLTIDYSVWYN